MDKGPSKLALWMTFLREHPGAWLWPLLVLLALLLLLAWLGVEAAQPFLYDQL